MRPIKPNSNAVALLSLYFQEKPASPSLFAAWIKRLFVFFILSLMVLEQSAWATCTQVSSTCIASTPCKTISGYQVCLAGVPGGSYNIAQSCWNYQNNYSCDSLNINTCGTTPSTCNQSGQTCDQTDPTTGNCILYTRDYSCSVATGSPPQSNNCGSAAGTQTAQTCVVPDQYPYVYNGTSYGPLEATGSGFVPSLNTTVPVSSLSSNPNYGQCLEYSNQYTLSGPPNLYSQSCTPVPGYNLNPGTCSVNSQSCASYNAQGICTNYNMNETCTVTTDSKVCGTPPANCSMTNSACVQASPVTNQCILWAQNYTCNTMTGVPTSTNNCTSQASSCVKTGEVCSSSDPYPMVYNNPVYGLMEAQSSGFVPAMGTTVSTSLLSANPNYGACYTYTDTYTCPTPTSTQGQVCTPIPSSDLGACTVLSTTCTATNAQGVCTNYSQNKSCAVTQQVNICGTPPNNFLLQNSTCAETDPTSGACVLWNQNWTGPKLYGAPAPVNNCQNQPANCIKSGQICALSDSYPLAYNSPVYGLLEATSGGSIPAMNNAVLPASQLISNPNFGTCLTYTDTYTCSTPSSTQTCSPVPQSNLGTCSTTSTTCTATDTSGNCTAYSQVKSCGVVTSYSSRSPGTATTSQQSTCNLIPSNCSLQTQTCMDVPAVPLSSCGTIENIYSCPNPSPPVTSCQSSLCIGANCYGSGDKSNQSFGAAVAALEVGKQMGKFGAINLFYGESHDCTTTLGIFSCCQVRSSPPQSGSNLQAAVTMGAQFGLTAYNYYSASTSAALAANNSAMINILGGGNVTLVSAPSEVTAYGADANNFVNTFGDSYSFDPMMSSSSFFSLNMADIGAWAGTAGALLAQYGVISPAFASAAQIGSAYYTIAGSCLPCFIAMSVMIVVQYLSQCSQQEMSLSLLRGKGLCHDIGSYCSDSIPLIGCVQTKEAFCCFDSKFALDVNVGGRPQIGKSWGSPSAPDCSGFSIAQISAINFGLINFSNAFGDIASNINIPNASTLQSQISNKVTAFYGTQTTPATQTQIQSMGQVLKTLPAQNAPAPNLTPTPPKMPCTTTWGPQVPDTFTPPDYSSTINISNCNPGGTLQLSYTGNCTSSALSPNGTNMSYPISSAGTVSIPVNMPYTCLAAPATATSPAIAGSLNTWNGVVVVNGMPGTSGSISW